MKSKKIITSNRFKRDYKKIAKRGYDIDKLEKVISLLFENETLPNSYRPHKLLGQYIGFWECHIGSDWLLIYSVSEDCLELVRTGTHSDLFK